VQSAHGQDLTFGWLSLDEGDNTPERFLDYLLACLEDSGITVEGTSHASRAGDPDGAENLLAGLIQGVIAFRREIILILDDYHHIQHPQIHTAVQYLVDRTPRSFHLILLTRSDPPIELARLRVAGQLAEIRIEHLRFSAAEAGAFLKISAGVQLSGPDVATLNARAEGWVAGLQMAAISLRGAADPTAFVTAFAGSRRYVFDYLIEQVLNRQTPAVCEFLLKTSVLEHFSAALCDAVAGTNGAAGMFLDAMERGNLFLVPLDNERGWYRYHHLFTELLKLILDQTHPGLAAELHRRACQWFQSQGMLAEALHHSLVAGDMELVARIVSENVLALVEHAEIGLILARIDSLPREQRASLPWLDVAYAWGLAYIGQNQEAELALTQAEQHMEALVGHKRDKMLGHIAAVRAYLVWVHGGRSAEAVAFAEKAEELLPRDEIAVRALNLTTLGNALNQTNDDNRAAEVLEQALSLAQQAGQSHVAMQAASGLAYALMILGKPRQAQLVCEQAIALAEAYQRRNVRPLTAVASVYALLARVWLEFAAFEKALPLARKAVALGELWGQLDTLMISSQYLVYALAFTNQVAAARERIETTRQLAQQGPPWHLRGLDLIELEVYLDSDPQDAQEIKREAASKQETALKDSLILTARVLLKQNRATEALTILEGEQAKFDRYGNYLKARCHILKALAHFQLKEQTTALKVIQQALEIAEPENLVLVFLREGAAMEKLLRLTQNRVIRPVFVARLLAAIESRHRHPVEPLPPIEALIEPLSERELEVMRHLNSYLSTPEIADLLVVSANTVRTHIKNIYGKLGVHGRSGAVKRARELGLLA
jgi:LuxR family maltose regulon positive regulatory protein